MSAELPSAEKLRRIALALEHRIEEARSSAAAFFSFVMVNPQDPSNPMRMRVAEHQAVAFEFYEAHKNGVIQWPTDTGKTLFTVGATLFELGVDRTLTIMLAGKSELIAQKPFGLVRSYLENPDLNARVRLVFPHLVPSDEPGQAWTDTQLTIDRPPGGADPSVLAVGFDSDFQGKKVGRYFCDDLLDRENCATDYQRKKLHGSFFSQVNSRLIPGPKSKGFVINVPWDKNDLTFVLMRSKEDEGGDGWPGLRMDIYGNVQIVGTEWRSSRLRPSRFKKGWYRLAAHDPDPKERVPLFPVRWSPEVIAEAKATEPPSEFARSRLCSPTAPEEQRCQRIWIDGGVDEATGKKFTGCLRRGTEPILEIDPEEFGHIPIYIGMDVSTGEADDESSIVPIGVLPDGRVALLNVEGGKWDGPTQATKAIDAGERYDADIIVESNGYQKTLKQWIVMLATMMEEEGNARFTSRDPLSTRVHALHTDDKKKESKHFGVEAIFGEFFQGEWVIPANEDGTLEPEIEAFVQECLDYRPGAHVGDRLMGAFVARAKAHSRIMALRKARAKKVKGEREPDPVGDLSRLNPARWRGKAASSSSLAMRKTGGF